MLAGRVLDRIGAFGQVLLIAAVLGSTIRADLYFIASIVPLDHRQRRRRGTRSFRVQPRAQRARDTEATRLFSGGFWIAFVVLAAPTAAYLLLVAIFVPRTAPAGSASLLPWIAFAPVAVFFGLTAYCAAPPPSLRAIRLASASGRHRH